MRVTLRTAARDMAGQLLPDTLTADQYRCTASGLPAGSQFVVRFLAGGVLRASRAFSADAAGAVDEVVTVLEPDVAAALPILGGASWDTTVDGWIDGSQVLRASADAVTVEVAHGASP